MITEPDERSTLVPIHVIEHHDSAYSIWRDAGVRRRVLLHIDAHHDLYGSWFHTKKPGRTARINISNFIYAAITDELVREVIWVVPDATWTTRAGRRDIVRELGKMAQNPSTKKPMLRISDDRISGTALGCPIHVCTLDNLPNYGAEPLLLDIDIDYLVIPNIGLRGIKNYGSLPWIWPAELVTRLKTRGLITDLVTIAYSVEGGYTPLQWKYFADELAHRLSDDSDDCEWASCLRRGAQAAITGDFAAAEAEYHEANRLHSTSGAPQFHLANLCAARGLLEEGQQYLRECQSIDPSYRTPFSTPGFWYLDFGRYARARSAFDRALRLDPSDSSACLGLGLVALYEGNWTDALTWFRRSLESGESVDAYRGMAHALAELRDYQSAIAAYEQSLKLALAGRRAITDQLGLSTVDGGSRPWDSDHGAIHERLARLYVAVGDTSKTIAAYRMAIAMTGGSPSAWAGLARAYARTHRRKDAIRALSQAALGVPEYLRRWGRVQRIRWKHRLQAWRDDRNPTGHEAGRPRLWGGM